MSAEVSAAVFAPDQPCARINMEGSAMEPSKDLNNRCRQEIADGN